MVKIVQKCKIFQKIQEIADDHYKFRTEYARNVKFVSNVQFWMLYCISLITQFLPKLDLGPFENELFIY